MSGSVLLSKFAVGQITVNIMVKESSELQSGGEVIIFNTEDGDVQVQVDTVKETVWMTQKGMAELFGVSVPAINQHVKNVYQEGELLEAATVKKNLIVQSEGSRKVQRNVDYYNLDMIIAVGYRVNSKRATAFRIWATKVLRDYLIKGFALDDNRFKKGQSLTHFKELIDRIREIRLSEKVFSEYKEKQRHLEKIESLKELERDLSEYRKTSNSI